MIKKLLYFFIGIVGIGFILGMTLFLIYAPKIPRLPDELKQLASSPPTEVFARDGELLATLGGRSYVSIERISPFFQQALIAAEDKRFFDHSGVDLIATARSLWTNLIRGSGPGASSITQQLTKNMFFSFRRSWERKLLEALASFAIEDRFTKDQILEAYSNLVYFGRYAYGIENASLTYFSKHAAELELQEAAMLAGLLNSPSYLNPFNNLERSKNRQKLVLNRMAAAGMIETSAIDSLWNVPTKLVRGGVAVQKPSYPIDYALEIAASHIGKDVTQYGGVHITTTIDPTLQTLAEQAISSGLNNLEKNLKTLPEGVETRLEGALVAVDIATGQIVAMVGGRNYKESTYNRALHARRHPGSSFKPVVYLTALEKTDINPATVIVDTVLNLKIDKKRTWSPKNFDKKFRGPVTLKYGLMKSINTISAQLIDIVRPEAVIQTARRLGVKSKLEPFLALSLGAQPVAPIEMAKVYSTIARGGVFLEHHALERIESRQREVMFEHLATGESRFASETIYVLIDMLRGVIDNGTGTTIRRRGFKGDVFGKTGTSSDYKDSWFCGAIPGMAVVIWVGYDDNRSMYFTHGSGVTGASGAAPIWADFLIRATAGEPLHNFPRPGGLKTLFMHQTTGEVSELPKDDEWISVTLKSGDATRLLEESIQKALADSVSADSLEVR